MGHLHACPLHLHRYHISYIIKKQETIHLTTISTLNRQKLLLNFSDYLIWKLSQSVVICHVRLCIVINHSLSRYHCREHKPTFQIINNWWLKYKFFLISSKYSWNCKQRGEIKNIFFIYFLFMTDHHNRPFITTDFP